MSYPIDLDEYTEFTLHKELERRKRLRELDLYDYCARKPNTKPCMFRRRHRNEDFND